MTVLEATFPRPVRCHLVDLDSECRSTLLRDLGITDDFTVGRIALILLSIRRRLLRFRHTGLPAVLAALILLSFQVVFLRHGQSSEHNHLPNVSGLAATYSAHSSRIIR